MCAPSFAPNLPLPSVVLALVVVRVLIDALALFAPISPSPSRILAVAVALVYALALVRADLYVHERSASWSS